LRLMELIIHTPSLYLHLTDAMMLVQYCIDGFIELSSKITL
jgi:hypothetical protein